MGLSKLSPPKQSLNQSLITELTDRRNLVIVIPSFNDWEALEKLLLLIDEIIIPQGTNLEVVIVDDYSTIPIPHSLTHQEHRQIRAVNILRLRRNLGHQRAIAVGLSYVYSHSDCDWVVVMDGDGEDNPFAIEHLLNVSDKTGNNKIIFAKRSKRSESYTFKFFYFIYKKLYLLLIGKEISVGNFSLLPVYLLKNVVVISEIWNHYSSGIYRSRIPYLEVDVPRAKRLAGQPKMNLVSLVTHGLSSIAVYGDIVGTRILLSVVVLLLILLLLLGLVLLIRVFTDWGIPGWATYVSGLLVLSMFQLVLIGTVFSLIILSTRNQSNLIPVRDYKYYVDDFFPLKP
ncbi:glycosyltransferase [Moorena sp. SIO3F7]|uniref:glycosyltransferase n=2 Tax=unclassified Moorena TaxID=2683338 RepID=UPI0013FFC6DE|nr:glycosyltransferase [Moorena sp. SIO3F7]NEQ02410.1 glycosyltransferase [Moorena sp. SIO3F7]